MIRIIIAASAPSPYYFIFFGLLQSLSYGVFLVTVRYYVKLVAPDELKTTAQSIALMAGFGAGGIIGSLLGGYLIDNYGISGMYTVCISLSFLAVLTLLISIILDLNKTQTA
jgi:MFS family permease